MPKKQQVRKYLRKGKHGWRMYRDIDHEYYLKTLPDGTVLKTKLSHGDGEIPPKVWQKMLKQMGITQEEFYSEI